MERFFACLVVVQSLAACADDAASCPALFDLALDGARTPAVAFEPDGLPEARVRVLIARSQHEIACGLSTVDGIPADVGMLFMLPSTYDWIINTEDNLFPIDMIFIRSNLTVVSVIAGAEAQSAAPRFATGPSHYLLEVNAGWAAANGVVADMPLRFDGFSP